MVTEDESLHRETLENLGRSPSAQKHMRIVLAMEAREGPNTSRQSRESHGETRSTLLSQKVWKAWKSPNDFKEKVPLSPFDLAESVIGRLQNTSSWTGCESECRDAVCVGVLRNSTFIP